MFGYLENSLKGLLSNPSINFIFDFLLTLSFYTIVSFTIVYMFNFIRNPSTNLLLIISIFFFLMSLGLTIVKQMYNFTFITFELPNGEKKPYTLSINFSTICMILYYIIILYVFFCLKTEYNLSYISPEMAQIQMNNLINQSMLIDSKNIIYR